MGVQYDGKDYFVVWWSAQQFLETEDDDYYVFIAKSVFLRCLGQDVLVVR